MEARQIFFTIVVPFGLFSIMAGLGLTLSIKDLLRVVVMPKAVAIGLTGQLILLPLLAFGLAELFQPSPVIAIGLIILAACPGGITSNAYVFASRGDVALSVTMTSISSLLTAFTMPLLTYLALARYAEAGTMVHLPILNVMRTLALLTVFPVVLGMITRTIWPGFAQKMVEPVRKLAIGVLIMIIIGNTVASLDTLKIHFVEAGLVSLTLNVLAMGMGYGLARLFRLPATQVISLTYEVGVQNISLALTLAITILAFPDYSVTSLVYALFMKITALSFLAISKKILREAPVTVSSQN